MPEQRHPDPGRRRQRRLWTLAWLLPLALVLLAACGAPPSGTGDPPEVVIDERARVVDDETRDALASFDAATGTLVFDRSTSLLAAIEANDVLVSDVSAAAPFGFLRTVTEVREEGGQVVVSTAEASLEDVIVQGTIDVRRSLTAADVGEIEPLLDGVHASVNRTAHGRAGVTRSNLDDYLISFSFENTIIDDGLTQVTLSGGLGIDLDLELVVDYGAIRGLQAFRFVIEADQRSEITLDASASGGFERTVDVARVPLQTQTVFVGPLPIVLTYELFITIGASGQFNAELVVGAAQFTEARLGASYVKDRSPSEWQGIAEFDAGFESLVDPSLTVSAAARAALGARASLLVYGLIGPNVGLEAFGEVEASVPGDPVWRLYGGLVARAGFIFEVPVFGRIVDFSAQLATTRQLVLSADNTPPTITAQLEDAVALFNRPLTLRATVSDPEDGTACCTVTWTSDVDGPLGTTAGGSPTIEPTFTTEGPRTITATATDSGGETSTAQFTIDVVNPPPSAAVAAPAGAVRAEVPTRLSALVVDPYRPGGGITVCNNIAWSVPGASPSSGFGCSIEVEFASSGPAEVTITVTGAEGATATATRSLDVQPRPENLITIERFIVSQTDPSTLLSDVVCPEGQTIIRSTAENDPFQLAAAASDEEGRTLLFQWSYSYEPVPTDGGADTRTFTVIDNEAEAEHFIGFEVAGQVGTDVTFRLIVDDGAATEDNAVAQDCSFTYIVVAN